ncbi:MAG TPA: alpha/beta hydrolase [Acidobacteriaceae bacterium]
MKLLRFSSLLFASSCLMFSVSYAHAQDAPPKGFASVEVLWPGGAPGALGTADGDVPKLYCYPAPGPGPHAAVVVLPGGGYTHVVMEKEGGVEARWLNEHGVSAYVLQYRLSPAYHYPAPMLDGMRAMRFVRSHAKAWGLRDDAIGVWGFSAGGHLAGYLATADPHGDPRLPIDKREAPADAIDLVSAHPDFAIFGYARLSLDPAIPGTFGMKTLIGDNPTQAMLDTVSPILHVTKDTSPSFLYGNSGDMTVSSLNATLFYNALQLAHVPAELHVFEAGGHGTGMAQNLPRLPELAIWPTLLQHWMQLHGWME